jgi:hypothetical protein
MRATRVFAVLAAAGTAASLTFHVLSYFGYSVSDIPAVKTALSLGVVVVWIPMVIVSRRIGGRQAHLIALMSLPEWLLVLVIVCSPFLAVGLAAPFAASEATESRDSGVDDRQASALWILFYGTATMTLFHAAKKDDEARPRRLPFDVQA